MKTIMVSLVNLGRIDEILECTASLARTYDSHVIGFYPIPSPTIIPFPYPGTAMPLDDRMQKLYEAESPRVRASFEEKMRKNGIKYEWRETWLDTVELAKSVARHGREADLIIMAHTPPGKKGRAEDIDMAANVVLGAGRPVLLIPPLPGKFLKLDMVVMGWDTSREASRAAFDSVPLIHRAKEVHLTWVDAGSGQGKAGKLPGTGLATALARHGVSVTPKGLGNRFMPGAALINYAQQQKADLLVLGAYGHSRLHERLLGGTTEHVLMHMDMPVLMST